jgi:putative transcription factor
MRDAPTNPAFPRLCPTDATTVIGYKTRSTTAGGASGSNAPTAYERAKAAGAINEFDRKVTAGTNKGHSGPDHARLAKVDRENEVAPPPKVPPTVGKAIGQGRQAKGMTQKDLGTKINEKPQVIAEYESGKAIPNPQILGKMERALGVKLRGKDIGAPLGGPAKK